MRETRKREIEKKAVDLLVSVGCLDVPVPLDDVARALGITVESVDLGEVSGVLVVKDGVGTIGYNQFQAEVRQRFSVAHELGHFVLHHDSAKQNDLYIDKSYSQVFLRSKDSETGEYVKEVEANQFAACLLMPKMLLAQKILESNIDIADEPGLKQLAEAFAVSLQAMSLRLAKLGLIPGA